MFLWKAVATTQSDLFDLAICSQSEELEDKLINLPSFLEALASIVIHLDTVSTHQIF